MFITCHLRRPAQLIAIACALLVPAGAAYAAADPLLAPERYYMSFAPADAPQGPAAQEQYYSSYGDPRPLTAPQSPSHDTPWIAIALSIAGALAIVAGTATQLRRIRVRRRRAAHTPA